jgi:hypothetical protein
MCWTFTTKLIKKPIQYQYYCTEFLIIPHYSHKFPIIPDYSQKTSDFIIKINIFPQKNAELS